MADIKINGASPSAFYYGGTAASAVYYGSTKLWEAGPSERTVRMKMTDGYTPVGTRSVSWTQVSSSPNVWDMYLVDTSVSPYLDFRDNLDKVTEVEANLQGFTTASSLFTGNGVPNRYLTKAIVHIGTTVTSLYQMFSQCTALTQLTIDNDDQNVVTNVNSFLQYCSALPYVPYLKLPVSGRLSTNSCFYRMYKVESGALAMYQQWANSSNVSHNTYTFQDCGRDTVTGAAELAQIPSSWGGTGA